MKFFDTVNDGIVQTLNRLFGATVNTYSFKAKIADINDALDWYFQLAFRVGKNWNFDDVGNTSPPIDTQNIVSGTNRYKISSFTEKIINLLKLEILNSSSVGQELIPETLDDFGNVVGNASGRISGVGGGSFQDIYIDAGSGTPTHYIKYGDFIYLRPNPNYNSTSGLKAFFNRPASKFAFVAATANATTDLFTATAHGLAANDTVIIETDGTIPTGLTADTQYDVISTGLTTDDFKVSATLGGSAIDITNGQITSNHAFLKTNGEPGIVSIHHPLLCRKAALTFLSYIASPKLGFLPQQVLLDERTVSDYFSGRDKDVRKRLQTVEQDNK